MLWTLLIHNVTSIHPPTKLFFRCLVLTDLGAGLLAQPLLLTTIMSPLIKMNFHNVFYVFHLVGLNFSWCLCNVCILTSAAVSVDSPCCCIGTEIQTCSNVKASSCSYNLFLVNWCFSRIVSNAENWFSLQGSRCYFDTFSTNYDFPRHEDPRQAKTSTSPAT